MDDTFRKLPGGYKVENELVLNDLKRSDLHTILTCQAANNNISVPVSTSVKLDMNCKFTYRLPKIHFDYTRISREIFSVDVTCRQ